MILGLFPGPMVASLSLLMFLLVMQFLIKYLPDLVGKDLPFLVLVELISYNLAYMLVLAVPMSVLIATLVAFGKLVDTNAYAVIKSSGVSFLQLVWPALLVGVVAACSMAYFNNEVLPEANFRASNLWRSIRVAKPGFDLRPGVFYDNIDQYRILVGSVAPGNANDLRDVTIFDYTDGPRHRVEINAARGLLVSEEDGSALNMELFDGEVHRRRPLGSGANDRYEHLVFQRHRLQIPTDDLTFDRVDPTSGRRNDRTTRSRQMMIRIDSLESLAKGERKELLSGIAELGTGRSTYTSPARVLTPSERSTRTTVRTGDGRTAYDIALQQARNARSRVSNGAYLVTWTTSDADRMRVEVHKKNSIAVACLIFVLIGAPLGLTIRRGGLGVAAAAAFAIFMFYWVTLVLGEKLADGGKLEPWIGMWAGNVVTGLIGIGVLVYVALDWRAVRLPWQKPLSPDAIGALE
jgi:lipopolysaccharide export system permease protein